MGIITILWEKWVEFRRDFYKITLAACLTHASRTKQSNGSFRMEARLTEWRTGE